MSQELTSSTTNTKPILYGEEELDFQKICRGDFDAGYTKDGTPIDPRNLLFKARACNEDDLSLWNDKRWKTARNNMTTEQADQYKVLGEQFHGSIDYVTGGNTGVPIPEPTQDSIDYILLGLRSGLNPDDLTQDEQEYLEMVKGENWRTVLGFCQEKNRSRLPKK